MQNPNITENLKQLQQAAAELARGFARTVELDRAEQADALREASAALIEMRKVSEEMAQELEAAQ